MNLEGIEENLLDLSKGTRPVMKYEAKFTRLAKYMPIFVTDDASMSRRRGKGLKENIWHNVTTSNTWSSVEQAPSDWKGHARDLKGKEHLDNKKSELSSGSTTQYGSFKSRCVNEPSRAEL